MSFQYQQKTAFVGVRLAQEERATLEELAKASDMTISDYVRRVMETVAEEQWTWSRKLWRWVKCSPD